MSKIALVAIPTYNEAANIELVISRLMKLNSRRRNYQVQLLFIDSYSPDGTGKIIKNLQSDYPGKIHLIQRKKAGLGNAYKQLFNHALKNLEFDVLVQMDADLSHDPDELPLLLEKIDEGYDVAIGSRYVEGGLIPGTWPMFRILNSKVAHYVARFVGGIESDAHELTGGFKAMTKEALKSIPYKNADIRGYGIQLFLSNEFAKQDMKIAEVPISFRDRTEGESKLRTKDIIEFIQLAMRLNVDSPLKRWIRLSLIGIFGIFNAIGASQVLKLSTSGSELLFASGAGIFSMLPLLLLERRNVFKRRLLQKFAVLGGLIFMVTPVVFGVLSLAPVSTALVVALGSLIVIGIISYLQRTKTIRRHWELSS